MDKKKSKKGQKISKSKKKKQEEEERRQREEEEARLRAEKEEQERIEQEKKQKEIERLELQDSKRREGELDDLRHLLERNHTALIKWKANAVERETWERYMRCDGIPDPKAQREINTYITLWRDNPEVNITCVLQQCSPAQQLIKDLEVLLKDAPHSEEEEMYRETIIDLLELIQFKQLLATEELLKNANESIDSETGNMQTVVKNKNVTVCVWANFRKNPRFKGFHFEETGLGFELPKQLAVSNVAVRLMHTHYDLLSLLARLVHHGRSISPRPCSPEGDMEDALVLEVDITDEEEEVKEEQQEIEEEEDQTAQESQEPEVKKSEEEEEDLGKGGLDSPVLTQMEILEAEGELTSPVPVPVPVPPETPTTHRVYLRKTVVDLMQYTPLGGVLYYDAFYLPPQAHRAKGWKIRQLLDQGLTLFPYPPETCELGSEEQLTSPPVGVSFTLPGNVIFLKTPRVARWDDAGTQWRLDGIIDVSYKKKEGKISIKMTSFQPLVLLQETYANFPFRSWELRPLGQDAALFTISGALIHLSFKIQGGQCMLQLEQDRGLPQLTDRWMSVAALQAAMISAGLNVFVNEHSHKYASACAKDPFAEHAAYEQMALLASACAFSWSRWNASCGSEHLVVRAREHDGSDSAPVPEQSWSLYLLGDKRSKKLDLTEGSETFSPDHAPGSEFHSTFIHILRDSMSAEGVARAGGSHYLFVSAVQSLLCGTRPLMYSQTPKDADADRRHSQL